MITTHATRSVGDAFVAQRDLGRLRRRAEVALVGLLLTALTLTFALFRD